MTEPADPTEPDDPTSPDLLLSDSERLHALTVLGDHYAAGRLDGSEFHSRSGEVAAARTLTQLRGHFNDLPGGSPLRLVDGRVVQAATGGAGELVQTSSSSPTSQTPATRDVDADLADLRRRGKVVESMDGVVIGITLITFLVLQLIVEWQWAWIVWPSLAVTLGLPRLILRFTDDDEETYEQIKESDQKARRERLRAVDERIRELGEGRDDRG